MIIWRNAKKILKKSRAYEKKSVNRNLDVDLTPLNFLFTEKIPQALIAGRREYSAYLITGNQKHFPEKEFILTPHHMLDILKG